MSIIMNPSMSVPTTPRRQSVSFATPALAGRQSMVAAQDMLAGLYETNIAAPRATVQFAAPPQETTIAAPRASVSFAAPAGRQSMIASPDMLGSMSGGSVVAAPRASVSFASPGNAYHGGRPSVVAPPDMFPAPVQVVQQAQPQPTAYQSHAHVRRSVSAPPQHFAGAPRSAPMSPGTPQQQNWTPATTAGLHTPLATGGRAMNTPRGKVGPGGAAVRVYGGRSYTAKPTTAVGPRLGPQTALSSVLKPAAAPHVVAPGPRYNPSVTDRRGTVLTANIAGGYIQGQQRR